MKLKLKKKEFYKSKHPIDLKLVKINKTVISDKFKHIGDGFKYFIGYKEDNIIRTLCIILPQMKAYIKYFENGRENMSSIIKDHRILVKQNKNQKKIKSTFDKKFHSMPNYDEKFMKAKVREYNDVIKTNFCGDKIPKNVCITLVQHV